MVYTFAGRSRCMFKVPGKWGAVGEWIIWGCVSYVNESNFIHHLRLKSSMSPFLLHISIWRALVFNEVVRWMINDLPPRKLIFFYALQLNELTLEKHLIVKQFLSNQFYYYYMWNIFVYSSNGIIQIPDVNHLNISDRSTKTPPPSRWKISSQRAPLNHFP